MSKVLRIRSHDKTEDNGFKLERKGIKQNFIHNRVADEWNGLSNHIVSAESIRSSKKDYKSVWMRIIGEIR